MLSLKRLCSFRIFCIKVINESYGFVFNHSNLLLYFGRKIHIQEFKRTNSKLYHFYIYGFLYFFNDCFKANRRDRDYLIKFRICQKEEILALLVAGPISFSIPLLGFNISDGLFCRI